ncbi:DUF2207 domain-containing protein [Candidatus Gottesmanbacteria bacterium]|nr:DUF2207 domain-containing protein [Candidatus Gottesmanbacteria bacterium]
MRKFFSIVFFIFFFILSVPSVLASEAINSFSSNIQINKKGTINVSETIVYDFSSSERRGIFREIPYIDTNKEGKQFELGFDVIDVTDENGKSYAYKVSNDGGNIVIRIGKEDLYITGIHTYVISYTVSGAIRYFSDHDELYWNITGNNWNVPIEKSQAQIFLNFNNERPKVECFDDCNIDIVDNSNINITSTQLFEPGEGLTFVVGFPKNLVAVLEPKEVVNFWDTLLGKLTLIFLIILGFIYYFIAPFIVFVLWLSYGRDPKTSSPVRAWYDPPKDSHGVSLKPAEVGTLVDEHADTKDISATIVDLAIRGYLMIKEQKKGKSFQLTKTDKDQTKGLNKFESVLLEGLFKDKDSVSTTDLKGSFYKTSTEVQDQLYEDLVKRGFFPKNPKKVRDKYYILGTIAFTTFNLFLGIMLFVFGRIMPRKTIFGAVSQNTALGLKNFLGSQARQLEFQAKNWHMFEKLLPYAIVFGVEKIWAERFQDIDIKPPQWYQGSDSGRFNSYLFVNNLNRATNSFSSMSSPPSSSTSSSGFSSGFSGGSSGGGSGGGGGGSW